MAALLEIAAPPDYHTGMFSLYLVHVVIFQALDLVVLAPVHCLIFASFHLMLIHVPR